MNDLQIAFEISQLERHARGIDERIPAALAKGLFVVAYFIEAYCPRTDAIMGTDRHFESAFPSSDLAENAANALRAEFPGIDVGVISPPVYGCENAPPPEVEIPF